MNIGFLHGCRQDSDIMRSLFAKYEKKIKKKFPNSKFFYIDSQYVHHEKGRKWYKSNLELDRIGSNDIPDEEIINSVNYLQAVIESRDINFLIGFSQGANIITTYLRLNKVNYNIKLAIIISGYDFPKYSHIPIEIPMLFIGSEQDTIVNIDLKPTNCINMIDILHERGHIVPQQSLLIDDIVNWIDIQINSAVI